jgi:hypothetical protein
MVLENGIFIAADLPYRIYYAAQGDKILCFGGCRPLLSQTLSSAAADLGCGCERPCRASMLTAEIGKGVRERLSAPVRPYVADIASEAHSLIRAFMQTMPGAAPRGWHLPQTGRKAQALNMEAVQLTSDAA